MHIEALGEEYAELWRGMDIRPDKSSSVGAGVDLILANRAAYDAVEDGTGVPWYVVGLIHKMEANCHTGRHLHNGDSLRQRTRRVPKGRPLRGRGPFKWHESAIDALTMKGYHKIEDWPIERICWALERYNGWGYRKYHSSVLSPYLWSYSNHYRRGKYVADGKWSSNAVSGQAGAMPILRGLIDRGEVSDPGLISYPVPEEVDQVEDVAEEFVPASPPAVQTAAKESKTILGGLVAAIGTVVTYFNEAVTSVISFAGDSVAATTSLGDVKVVAASLGANVEALGFGLGLSGVLIVIVRRLEAARLGKIG